jgi:hypothetical protein
VASPNQVTAIGARTTRGGIRLHFVVAAVLHGDGQAREELAHGGILLPDRTGQDA